MRLPPFRALGAVLLSIAVGCSALGPSSGRSTLNSPRAQALKTVLVAQEVPNGVPGHFIGSGFLVHVTKRPDGKYIGTFLTAKHVVDLNTPTTIVLRRPNDPRRYYARVKLETIKRHKTFDAAMFVVSGLPEIFAKPVPIASAAPTVGDWVLSSGYSTPTQREIHAGHVIVEGIKLPRFGQCFMSNGRIIRGMSGGPVLNRKGEAVGIVVAKDGDNEQYSVSLHALKAWLKTVR
jgi:S1-C subfamily serine protease